MAPSASSSAALLLCLNLLLFVTVVTACPPPPSPPPPKIPPTPRVTPPTPRVAPPTPRVAPPTPRVAPPTPKAQPTCPVDTLKLAACDDVLGGLINIQLGTPPKEPCCSLVGGLDDAEAAVCLCTVIKINALGLTLNMPVDLSLLVNYCGKGVPSGFVCA
ncbi:lipid transfer protein EARLI 1-like [Zingiber officinale]|uniref:Bifunctional inhibitor/plant lipid transfer protein/seed storage helical domain-containing protein n=1 Tax=Zingiber officinale TaxID=94328 RepID=A0A8J5G258_ZINOF|nr:lipid transfer protein EARLI 1-like [Zingiber officinale]KAG6490059.1 hypothetical protein ZIOFF_051341 [Zingiber officinale]